MIKAYRRTSFRYDFIRENHEKEINFSFKFVSQEGKDKKKPHFKGLNLHFELNTIKHQIDKVEKNMSKPNFNRNNEIIGSCQGSLVLIKGTVYLNIGMLLKNIHSVPIECIGISGKGKARKISKVIND